MQSFRFSKFLSMFMVVVCALVLSACRTEFAAQKKGRATATERLLFRYNGLYALLCAKSALCTFSISPEFEAGDIYSIDPALPAGFSMDVNTGEISGTSAIAVAEDTYTITRIRDQEPASTSESS